jgi:hypothetical protein
MPVTTVDIPQDLMNFMDDLINNKKARDKREIFIAAVTNYRKFTMFDWRDACYYVRGIRYAWLSRQSLHQLLADTPKEKLFEAGRTIGSMLRDCCLATFNLDVHDRKNWNRAFQIMADNGWGVLQCHDQRIIVHEPYLPPLVLHGFLESALGIKLGFNPTAEDIAVFEIK